MTITLADFLLARIAEDEAEARGVLREYEDSPPSVYEMAQVPMLDAGAPDRVLAECEAKHRIIALHSDMDPCDAHDGATSETVDCDTLRLLALPFADHPDYDEAWRP